MQLFLSFCGHKFLEIICQSVVVRKNGRRKKSSSSYRYHRTRWILFGRAPSREGIYCEFWNVYERVLTMGFHLISHETHFFPTSSLLSQRFTELSVVPHHSIQPVLTTFTRIATCQEANCFYIMETSVMPPILSV